MSAFIAQHAGSLACCAKTSTLGDLSVISTKKLNTANFIVESSNKDVYTVVNSMNEENLNSACDLLEDILTEEKREPVWLVVGGGSALLVQRLSTRQTKDVDVMALREWEGNVISAYPLPESVKQAARTVAHELKLDPDWLNGAASLHFSDLSMFPSWFWQDLDTREYGQSLKISFIRRRGLILLKLCAALDRDQRRDLQDLVSLSAAAGELEEQLGWILKNIYETQTHPKLATILQELGHADLIYRFQ